MSSSWGPLGKPPAKIFNGTYTKRDMDMYELYRKKADAAAKIRDVRKREEELEKIRGKYHEEFPDAKD